MSDARHVRKGRGKARGKRHPFLPRILPWVADGEWRAYAAQERGRRSSSLLLSIRFLSVLVGLALSALLLWTYVPDLRWLSVALILSVALSALMA